MFLRISNKIQVSIWVNISNIWKEGEMSIDFQRNKLIVIPKKAKAAKCEGYRILSLLSHVSKISENNAK